MIEKTEKWLKMGVGFRNEFTGSKINVGFEKLLRDVVDVCECVVEFDIN